ncbi:MAG: single-strand selective monofunctional uracil DNA glycosylase [Treponematales bacterium]
MSSAGSARGAAPSSPLIALSRAFAREAGALRFSGLLVYNPLVYAREVHERYLERYARPGVPALLLGMNPGPWGMAQTGVPFGEVEAVRSWMGLEGRVGRPEREHPARPVLGFAVTRREVSGRRLWGLMHARFGTADECFDHVCVLNYCPLAFFEEASGRNVTPNALPKAERDAVEALCGSYLIEAIRLLRPGALVGVGAYARDRLALAAEALASGGGKRLPSGGIPHPSPANPAANKDWAGAATAAMREMGLWT